jgi:hypothetical protein
VLKGLLSTCQAARKSMKELETPEDFRFRGGTGKCSRQNCGPSESIGLRYFPTWIMSAGRSGRIAGSTSHKRARMAIGTHGRLFVTDNQKHGMADALVATATFAISGYRLESQYNSREGESP